jgi:hypothetical protein
MSSPNEIKNHNNNSYNTIFIQHLIEFERFIIWYLPMLQIYPL